MAVYQGMELTQLEQDVVGNVSRVRFLWQSTQTGSSYNDYLRTAKFYISINGGTEEEHTASYRLLIRQTVTIVDTILTVPHRPDGTGSITVRTWMDTDISAGVITLEKSLELTPIPRATTLGATDAAIGAVSMVALSRKSDSYSHSIAVRFGQLSGWLNAAGQLVEGEEKLTALNIPFPLPEDFYAQIPDAASAPCTLTCTTYLGDTVIGTPQSAVFTVTADQSLCAPALTGTVTDENAVTAALTGDERVMVRYLSRARCQAEAQTKNSARLTSLTIDGVEENPHIIEGFQQTAVVFRACDSRGYTAEFTAQPRLVAYVPLTVNASARRTDPTSGRASLQVSGNFYNGSFGAAQNTLALSCRVDGGEAMTLTAVLEGNAYRSSAELTGLDYLQSHTIEVTATDLAASAVGRAGVGKGIPVFDWGEGDFTFHVPVRLPGEPAEDTHAVTKAYADTKAEKTHSHAASDLAAGTLEDARLPVIPVEKGGTGATTPAAARQNLGLGLACLYTGSLKSGAVALDGSCAGYLVVGNTTANNSRVSTFVPAENDGSKFQLYADGHWITFTVTDGTLTVVSASSTGAITDIYGIT